MKPTLADLRAQCPDIPEPSLNEYLARLDENYFAVFNLPQMHAHLRALEQLRPEHPAAVIFESGPEGQTACTVLAFDYPAEFSLITGVLSAMGFDILSGDVFTYAHAKAKAAAQRRRRSESNDEVLLKRRKIIDRFSGVIRHDLAPADWRCEFVKRLEEVIGLLEARNAGCARNAEGQTEARHKVNELVASRLAELDLANLSVLYPVSMEIDTRAGYTRLRVTAQDTPAFLYALSTALALQGVSIERVRIRTVEGRVEDEMDVLDGGGHALTEGSASLDRIRLAVLLTKQFTYFVCHAPDPYAALCRFEQMVDAVLKLPERGQWVEMFSNPRTLQDLARLLGTSDFVWEDFVRLQYESLLPMLQPHVVGHHFARTAAEQEADLQERLHGESRFEEQGRRLNAFKDRELFLIDLDHILNPAVLPILGEVGTVGTRAFAEALTSLAELVIRAAADIVQRNLQARFGIPRTVAGLEARWTLCGLGKFGGVAMGYASDIEVLFVYSDSGHTDGPEVVENAEYFDQFVRLLAEVIKAKREGIFHVDTRLRPYGTGGPMACSLESFCRYYGPGGPAHAYERLALARLRTVGGDPALGAQVERLRDEFVYSIRHVNIHDLRDLRARQLSEKAAPERYNAKFSPGALVDLEYDVQILQVMHGGQSSRLRTPRIHEALSALSELGVLTPDESRRLAAAYYFLRQLINGLRMLRGSARDLFLPPEGSDEFAHLARRMGYQRGGELKPEQQLRMDFETHTAVVRAFMEHHFGRDSMPGQAVGNVADLVLSGTVPPDLRNHILIKAGFRDTERANVNLRKLAGAARLQRWSGSDCGQATQQELFARLAVLACDFLRRVADPDMALNNWERFARSLPDAAAHFQLLLSQPRRLEILMGIFSASQFLADTLIRNPDFFDWVTNSTILHAARPRDVIEADLRAFVSGCTRADQPNGLRRFRRREILRIGTRDICLHAPIQDITASLSALAEASIRLALEWAWESVGAGRIQERQPWEHSFCILAFGKLGGGELNYSSDIDLLGVCADVLPGTSLAGGRREPMELFASVLKSVGQNLSVHTEEGHAYRVDFRLRPYGHSGQLVYTVAALADYYAKKAALWEIQALLKARPVAGNAALGAAFLEHVRPIFMQPRPATTIILAIETLRETAIGKTDRAKSAASLARVTRDLPGQMPPRRRKAPSGPLPSKAATGSTDVKSGLGGIRDIEFLVQGLQLIHAPRQGELLDGNTFSALERLKTCGLLPEEVVGQLQADYTFLRRVEHILQIFEDRQIHAIPQSEDARAALARRVLGPDSTADRLMTELDTCQQRVRRTYTQYFLVGATGPKLGA
ncbi:MAG: glutamate-ammonia-ligase adenylyltransferase [Verrucomicrobia bacterium]|nr:glutamate-ammonia-ligase adenylyltransferase [Verrucomicrobiota bacterium]